ncbi:inverse autotransporter beta domain-containing protein [Citrobacter werkmanii]|uniref:inverse autotransporter beta domain-containing protein n=1 Tax=Citrobacter werkmanii TaxID=67827 RepID=UPI00300DAFFA
MTKQKHKSPPQRAQRKSAPATDISPLTRLIRRVAWFNIMTQALFPVAAAFTPAVLARADDTHFLQSQVQSPTTIYTLGDGETVDSVAAKFGITVAQLKALNQFRVFAHGFDHLKAGDELDVPALVAKKPGDNSVSAHPSLQADPEAAELAGMAQQTGSFLQDANSEAALGMAKGALTDKADEEINHWLSHFGTARVQLGVDDNFSLKDSSLDLLIPVWERKSDLVFGQGSMHRTDDRTQANLGLGMRHFENDYMVGLNSFLDYDLSRDHARAGMGMEYWRDDLKLAANLYRHLTGWKASDDLDGWEERPADGFDVRAEGYLPSYPQLGAKVVYEKYYGDHVGLFGDSEDDLQKNPQAVTVGVNYTPFPLMTFSLDQKQGESGENDTELAMNMSYQIGSPLNEQLDGDAVATRRSLAGSRYDLVDRNNNIVLEYRKKSSIGMKTVGVVSGFPGDEKTLGVSVNAPDGFDHIEWQADTLYAQGGQIISKGGYDYDVIIPNYNAADGASNTYTIHGVAYDKKGNHSSPSETQVSVAQSQVDVTKSTLDPTKFALKNNGTDTQVLTLTLKDSTGRPVTGLEKDISLIITPQHVTVNHNGGTSAGKLRSLKQVHGNLHGAHRLNALRGNTGDGMKASSFTETSAGTYTVTITAGTDLEVATFTPVVQNKSLTAAVGVEGNPDVPLISNLTLSGTLEVGQQLKGAYEYHSAQGPETDKSAYAWGEKGTTAGAVKADSAETVTSSGTIPDYTIVENDAGKVLEASVQARNNDDTPVTGNTLTLATDSQSDNNDTDGGDNGDIVDPTAGPQISNLAMTGTMEVDQKLSATYDFNANTGEPTDKSTFAWGHKGETATAAASGESVTTSGTVPDYTLLAADAGLVMEVSVQAKNAATTPVTGNTATATADDTNPVVNPTAAPVLSNLKISGTLEVGSKLSGTYTFDANGGEPTDKSTYVWGHEGKTKDSVTTGKSVAATGVIPDYTIVQGDTGEVMEVSVQGKNNATTPKTGNVLTVATSADSGGGDNTDGGDDGGEVIDPNATPQVSNLKIAGTLDVGQTLTGTYTFDANGNEPTDKSVYAWGHQGATAGDVTSGDTIVTSGTVPGYKLVSSDAGQVMELSVQAKDAADEHNTGNILTVATSADSSGGDDTDGGDDGGKVIDPTAAPKIADLHISGTLDVGSKLSGTYSFDANTGEPTDKSTFAWGVKGSTEDKVASGSSVTTSGQVPDYTIAQSDTGNVMELSVEGKNNASPAVAGNILTVATDADSGGGDDTDGGDDGGQVIDPTAGPKLSDLKISGTLNVGEKLSGTYVFDANGGEGTDKSTYAWGHENETSSKVAAGSTITTSGDVPDYTLAQADAGNVMELSVQGKNAATSPVTGNTLTVATSADSSGGDDTDGGDDGGDVIDQGAAPAVSNLAMTGTLNVGEKLSATYTFDAKTGEPTDKSTFAWGHQNETAQAAASGDAVDTSGTVPDYTLTPDDAGQIMEVSVQAKNNASTPVAGNIATADSTSDVIDPTAGPEVSKLVMTGTMEVDQKLSATYTFDANSGEPTDKSTFAWGHKGETAAAAATGSTITASGTVPDYTLLATDAGSVMEVSVQAKNNEAVPVTGNTATTTAQDTNPVVDPTAAPKVADLAMTGTMDVGSKLSATYTFDVNKGEPTDKSTFAWGHKGETAAAAPSGSSVTTSGTVPDYTLLATDAGSVMEVSVQAKNNASTPKTGNTATKTADDTNPVIDPTAAPKVADLALTGTEEVGSKLSATYTFDANKGEPTDKSTFAWGHKGETAAAAPSGSSVTATGVVPDYTLLATDAGSVMEVSVQAKNNASTPKTGNTATKAADDTSPVIDPTAAPKVADLAMTGTMDVGSKLSATYTFDANKGEPTDKSTFAWGHKGETAAAAPTGSSIAATGVVPDYTLASTDAGSVMEVSVQAKNNASTPKTGNTATKAADDTSPVIDPTAKPVITALAMTGTLEVGQSLSATYTFDANKGEPTDKSTFAWGEKDSTAAKVDTGTTVTTSGTVPPRLLVAGDTGKVMEVSVEAKNNATTPQTGNVLTVNSTPSESGNNTSGGDEGKVVNPGNSPVVSALTITGTLEVGSPLSATYTFDANGGEGTDKSTYVWGHEGETAAKVVTGSAVTTSGSLPDYTLLATDAGSVMEASVQAKNGAAAPVTGNTVTKTTDASTPVIDPTAAPKVADLAMTGTMDVGSKLSATYTFDANKGEPTDKSTFAWGHKGETATAAATGEAVTTTEVVPDYTLLATDAGNVMEVSVVAKNNASTPKTGNTATKTADDTNPVIDPTAVPKVADLAMTGTMDVGSKLSATYTFDANKGEPTDKSTFAWGHKGETAAAAPSGSSVTATGVVPDYTLTSTDAGEVMEVSVVAKNNAAVPATGNTETKTADDTNPVIDPTAAPKVADLAMTGTMDVGSKLSATYTFDANKGEPTDKSTFAWGHKGETATAATTGSAVATSGTVPDYTLASTDAGNVMEVSVVAKNNATVPVTGNTVTKTADDTNPVIDPTATPKVADLAMTGTLEVNQTLSATYTFDANKGEPTDKSTFAWGEKGSTTAKVDTGTVVTTSGTVPDYPLTAADVGKVMEVSVEAKNNATTPATGNTMTVSSTPKEAGNNTDGGDNGKVIDPAATPEVSNLAITGTLEVGQKLSGTYTWDAKGNNSTDKSTFKWGTEGTTAGSVSGGDTVTTSGQVEDFTLTETDAGNVMELSVMAKNGATVPVTGNTVTKTTDESTPVIDPTAAPKVADLAMTGTMEVAGKLSATYTFDANKGEPTDKSTFAWGHKGETADAAATGTAVTTSGTVPDYTITTTDAGEVMEVSVVAKNNATAPQTGNTETKAADDTNPVIDPTAKPVVSDLALTGTMEVDQKLSATYTFDANKGEPTDKSTFAWGHKGETATAAATGAVVTSTEVVPDYTLTATDAGEVMEVSVVAKNNATVPQTGNTATKAADDTNPVIDPTAKPKVADLAMTGTLNVGDKLSATYTFDANKGEPTDKSTYLWGEKGATAGQVSAGETVDTSGTVPDYDLTSTDVGKVMEVSVMAKNNATVPQTGNTATVTSTPSETGNSTDGGDNGKVIDPTAAPKISDLSISGTLEVGKALSGTYIWSSNNGEPTDKSTFKWGAKDSTAANVANGSVVTTSGKADDYTLVTGDVGNVMELSVQAKNGATAPVLGNVLTVASTPGESGNSTDGGDNGQVIDPEAAPQISNLVMTGTLEVGNKLSATYSFDAKGGEPTDKSTYAWGEKGSTTALVANGGSVVTTGTVPDYTLVTTDAGKVMEVSVKAKNAASTPVTGNVLTVTSTPAESGNSTNGGDNGKVIDPDAIPSITGLTITHPAGQIQFDGVDGTVLSGTYTFQANNGEPTDKSVYTWGYKDETADKVTSSTDAVTVTGKVPDYTVKEADVGKTIELSVLPENAYEKKGTVQTKAANDIVEADAEVIYDFHGAESSDAGGAPKVKNTETITADLSVVYSADHSKPVKNYSLSFAGIGYKNRKNVDFDASSTPVLVNGSPIGGRYDIPLDSNGKATITVTQPNGPGVKSEIPIWHYYDSSSRLSYGSMDVVFTVLTSPDVPQANMWGHMPDVVGTLHRPLLATEASISSTNIHHVANEDWPVFHYADAVTICSLQGLAQPFITDLRDWFTANGDLTQYGWPPQEGGSAGTWSMSAGPTGTHQDKALGDGLEVDANDVNDWGFAICK